MPDKSPELQLPPLAANHLSDKRYMGLFDNPEQCVNYLRSEVRRLRKLVRDKNREAAK